MADVLAINPSKCSVRHIRRGEEADPSAQQVARVYFVDEAIVTGRDGINGRQGWVSGSTTGVLSDDGTFTLTLPNVDGDDGVLHRRRFRILTDSNYEPGEEWLEFKRDDEVLFVGTPTDYKKNKTSIEISGADLSVVLAGAISSDVDIWDGNAPADVLRHYAQVPVLAYGDELAVTKTGGAGAWAASPHTQAVADVAANCWTAEARMRWTSAKPSAAGASFVRLDADPYALIVDVFDGSTTLTGAPERDVTGKAHGLTVPGSIALRLIARYDRIFGFVNGKLVAEFRRPTLF